jgi:hypothetical protein
LNRIFFEKEKRAPEIPDWDVWVHLLGLLRVLAIVFS